MMTLREDRLREALQVNIEAMNDTQFKLQLLLSLDLTKQSHCYTNSEIERTEAFMAELRTGRLQLKNDYDHARAQRLNIAEFLRELTSS